MLRQLALFLVLATPVWAQVIRNPFLSLPTDLREYLELTPDQVMALGTISARFQSFQSSKLIRQFQVQAEIAEELTRETIDPMALGLRHRELALILREIEAERQKNRTELLAVLTAAQRIKLTTLDQALRLQNTACSAVSYNLLTPPPPTPVIFDPATSLTSLLLGLPGLSCGSSSLPGAVQFPRLP